MVVSATSKGELMPYIKIHHEVDPRQKILDDVGDLSSIKLFNNEVLVAVYMRPNKTMLGGKEFFMTDRTVDEDRYQSKVGLLLAAGPNAFEPNDQGWFAGETFTPNQDWLVFRPSDGWSITVHGVLCRVMKDGQIKARVQDPDEVY